MVAYVIVPGLDGSDENHWQTRWERRWGAAARRIRPGSWADPELSDWLDAVDRAHAEASAQADRVVFVAHSLGCWAVAEWARETRPTAVASFLVAPPDPDAPGFPVPSFRELAAHPVPGPALVVASDDDPYCAADRSRDLATGWGARLRLVEGHGHINSDSGLGYWPAGRELLGTLETGPA
ncbi:RBBP9/YdeN family alpha/beta hydrolase [Streptomyces millisiae]|uniref:Alpha/beta hydrolase n=1 Tax=Streptomyces millisiae TaxID=3075542 RepID=A0ABU2LIY1_9ACTN|nr:alpha/beta hydrolase [Streptomyces sp. DSM 44918]MDT0317537.1 alpha/beta hydrolase [Streptomyces sp. DSM 44918]